MCTEYGGGGRWGVGVELLFLVLVNLLSQAMFAGLCGWKKSAWKSDKPDNLCDVEKENSNSIWGAYRCESCQMINITSSWSPTYDTNHAHDKLKNLLVLYYWHEFFTLSTYVYSSCTNPTFQCLNSTQNHSAAERVPLCTVLHQLTLVLTVDFHMVLIAVAVNQFWANCTCRQSNKVQFHLC